MIFITVGTQRFQFNRLLSKIDDLIEAKSIQTNIIAQIGYSTYIPKNYVFFKMIESKEMDNYIEESELIITHSGTSSIIKGLQKEKKVIVVPRQKVFNEHVDDHQLEIARMFALKNFVEPVYDIEHLEEKLKLIPELTFSKYKNESETLLHDLSSYIEKII